MIAEEKVMTISKAEGPAGTRRRRLWRHLKKAPLSAWIGIVIVLAYMTVALLAPWIAPHGETEVVGGQYDPWSDEFLLGTDQLGRDMLSRLIYGARNTISVALMTTSIAFVLGTGLGLLAATVGGWVDQLFSRIVDVIMAIPQFIFALLLLSIFGTSVVNLVLIIAVLDSTRLFRVSRSVALNVTVLDFVEAARLQGEGTIWIMIREILPNILAPIIAEFGMRFCFVFLTIAALSFLGLGIQPPTADWGSMVRENATLINYGDITPLLPAGAIALLTIGVNFIVDWFLHITSGLKE